MTFASACGDTANEPENYHIKEFHFDLGTASASGVKVEGMYIKGCGASPCDPFTTHSYSALEIPTVGTKQMITYSGGTNVWDTTAELGTSYHYGYKIDPSVSTTFTHVVVGQYKYWNDWDKNGISGAQDASEPDLTCAPNPSQTVTGDKARLTTASRELSPLSIRSAFASADSVGCIRTILNTQPGADQLPSDFPFKSKVRVRAWSLEDEDTLDRMTANWLGLNGNLITPSTHADIAYDAQRRPKQIEVCVDTVVDPAAKGFAVAIDWFAKTNDTRQPDVSMYVGLPTEYQTVGSDGSSPEKASPSVVPVPPGVNATNGIGMARTVIGLLAVFAVLLLVSRKARRSPTNG